MASDLRTQRTTLKGLLVPDQTMIFDESQSTLTQAGARAGYPLPARRTTTAMVASGVQTAANGVGIEAGGGVDAGLSLSGRYLLTKNGDTFGWDQPSMIAAWEDVANTSNDSQPRAICAVDGETLLVAQATADAADDPGHIWIYRKVYGGAWTEVYENSTVDESTIPGSIQACFVQLPSGRVLCYYTSAGIDIYLTYSDDGGINWLGLVRVYTTIPFDEEGTGAPKPGFSQVLGLCGAYLDGNVVLFINVRRANSNFGTGKNRDGFIQLASSDLGQSFIEITTTDWTTSSPPSWTTGAGGTCTVSKDGRIMFAWVSGTSNPSRARIARLSSAYSPFTDEADEELTDIPDAGATQAAPSSGEQMSDWDLTLVTAENGVLWAYVRDLSVVYPLYSEDHGVTWLSTSDSGVLALTPDVGHLYRSGNSDSYPRSLFAAPWRNGVAMVCSWSSDSGFYGPETCGLMMLGGWRQITMAGEPPDRWTWHRNWLPFDEPNDVGWVRAGAGTATLTPGALNVTTSSNAVVYSKAMDGTRMAMAASLAVVDSSVGSKRVFMGMTVDLSGTYYEIEVRIGESNIAVYDVNSGLQMGSTYTIDCTAGVMIYLVMASFRTTVYAGPLSVGGPQVLEEVISQTSATSAIGSPGSEIRFGTGLLSTTEANWYSVMATSEDSEEQPVSSTSNVIGAPLSTHLTYLSDGVSVRAEGGPAWADDTWEITPEYDYSIHRANATESPSPRRTWRSTADNVDTYIAFSAGGNGQEYNWGNRLVAFGFFNVNFSIGEIQTRSTAGTWSTLFDFSSSAPGLIQMAYTRNGPTLVPSSSTGGNPFLRTNELAGASIYLASGFVVRILSNTAGRWSTATGQRAVITIDDSSLEPADVLSGTASVIPKDFVVITRVPSTAIEGFRLYIEAQDTAEGYYEIGTLVAGHVEVFADEYSWGRKVDIDTSVERTRLRGGTTRTRVLAPPRRRISFDWEGGVDSTSVEGTEPDPNYVTSSSTASSPAVGSVGATPYQLEGLLTYLDSGAVPVVYLPEIPLGSTGVDTHTLNRRDQFVLTQVVSAMSRNAVLGEEGSTELWRVAQVELEEVT